MTAPDTFQIPPGLVIVTTYGQITAETVQSIWDTRSLNDRQGAANIAYRMVGGALVDKARNESVRMMLRENRGWLLFIDGDMSFAEDAVLRLLRTAFQSHPWADVVGGYCNLRGELAIPTIDTGTGTWESHFPNSGVLEVMRTGAAFLLVKRHVCERLPDPWFAMRVPMRPLDAMAEVDNFSRIKFDGDNPLRGLPGEPWERLERVAVEDPSTSPGNFIPVEVGEDSGFCDKVKAAGMRIVVDTGVVTRHVDRKVVGWEDHRDAMRKREIEQLRFTGILWPMGWMR